MFILKQIFTKSAVGLAITLSLGSQMSRAMDENLIQKMEENSTTSKKTGEFQIDNILLNVEATAIPMDLQMLGLRACKVKALREEKELFELASFFMTVPKFRLEEFYAEVPLTATPMDLQMLGLRACKVKALREEKELFELASFFMIVPSFDLEKFYADVQLTANQMELQSCGLRAYKIKALREEKELYELTSFFIIEELKNELIPAIMIFSRFLNEQNFPEDVKNVITQKLFFLRLGSRFICPPTK